jgi:hypothetical protein
LGRTSHIAKEKLGFWSSRDLVIPIGLTFDFEDSGQAPTNGDFGPLSKKLYDLGNISKLNTRHNGMVRVGFLE